MTDHSQNGEQAVLLNHFGGKSDGRFLDIGAHDGVGFSNTHALALSGWSGVCVEPSPKPFAALFETYKSRLDILLVNAAIANTARLATWHDSDGDYYSTLNEGNRQKWSGVVPFRSFVLSTTTLPELLDLVGREFDLISIDVEGGSAELAELFPWADMPRVSAVVIEHDDRDAKLKPAMLAMGFREATRNAENSVYLR